MMLEVASGEKYFPIYIEKLEPNRPIAFDLYLKSYNRFVLYSPQGHVFNAEDLHNLALHRITYLYAKANGGEYFRYMEAMLPAIISDQKIDLQVKTAMTYNVATETVKTILEDPRSGDTIKRSKGLVTNITNLILASRAAFMNLMKITSHDYYTYTHSINVCTLAVALAKRVGIRHLSELNAIGLGGLLHDLGKCNIDLAILNKPGPLDEQEWQIIHKHPEWGLELAKKASQRALEINDQTAATESNMEIHKPPEDSLTIIHQHHESCDGRGYPLGLTDKEIHLYAKIVRIVDIYDALTTNRSYKKALSPYRSLQLMHAKLLKGLDRDIFFEFIFLLGYGTR